MEHQAQARAFRRRVVRDQVDDWCSAHRDALAPLTAAWVALGPGDTTSAEVADHLRDDALAAVVRAHQEGREGGVEHGRPLELPDGLQGLGTADIGVAVTVNMGDVGGPVVAVVLERRTAVLDGGTRELVERRLSTSGWPHGDTQPTCSGFGATTLRTEKAREP